MPVFKDKNIVVTGGTGSLGGVLIRHLLSDPDHLPEKIMVFSRDEAKQHFMRSSFNEYTQHRQLFEQRVQFRLGDVRDYHSVCGAIKDADIIINTAALKQVPSCEYFPHEAVKTNIAGAQNIVRAIKENKLAVQAVVGVSTDKACKPVNVMGMTKAIQERIFINANLECPETRFICVRYGNVLASRGSVIPMFIDQILNGGPVTLTDPAMTRFLLPLEKAVETIVTALDSARAGEIFVPIVPAARITDVARALIDDRDIELVFTGIRPGEKIHEILVSQEEAMRTYQSGAYYVITAVLPELNDPEINKCWINREYSSADQLLSISELEKLLATHQLKVAQFRNTYAARHFMEVNRDAPALEDLHE